MNPSPTLLDARDKPQTTVVQSPSTPPLSKHFPTLDGLRGVAILGILALHYGEMLGEYGIEGMIRNACGVGYLGVNLFFVLSGFLITRILVQTRENRDYFSTFFRRRSLRIFPLYYAYLGSMILIYYPYSKWRVGEPYQIDSHFLWYLAYASNIFWNPLDDPGLTHLWSLAIEEQFYLVWPLVVFFTPRRWLLSVCVLGFFASFASRVGMTLAHCDYYNIYALTPCRMDALLIGAAAGIIELKSVDRHRLNRVIQPLLAVATLVLVAFMAQYGWRGQDQSVHTVGWSLVALVFAVFVFWAATAGSGNWLLNASWLRLIGKYSYGIYMFNMIVRFSVARHLPNSTLMQRLVMIGVSLVGTAICTAISWHFIELPFLRLKRRMT